MKNIDSATFKTNNSSDNEVANKKNIDNELDKDTVLGFDQTLENYLKVTVGNDTYNPTKVDKKQIRDTTNIKCPNTGGFLLQSWVIKCVGKINNGKIQNFKKSTKTNSPTGYSGAESLPPFGNSVMFIETNSSNSGSDIVFRSFERTDVIQITKITFYSNRFSILPNDSLK